MNDSRLSRRTVLKAGVAALFADRLVRAQSPIARRTLTIETTDLRIGIEDSGDPGGFPIILLHGFPDDVRAWDDVIPLLVERGYRTITPYLRGHGETRFRPGAFRSGEQAALAQDVIDVADSLHLPRFSVAGYDWGSRAACVAAARHPDRVRSAVLVGGYSILNPFAAQPPAPPERERARWYFWYFNTERGRDALTADRRRLCRFFWETWSPTWKFSEETFNRTAVSFDNPDFVDVVIHVYRYWFGNAKGDPRFDAVERELARRPKVQVPTLLIYGPDDGVAGPRPADDTADRADFSNLLDRRSIAGAGHFVPRENPTAVARAILDALNATR